MSHGAGTSLAYASSQLGVVTVSQNTGLTAQWNAGIETIDVEGPFEIGTTFTMTPPGDEPIRMRLAEIEPGTAFTDEMDAGDFSAARQATDVKVTSEVLRKLEAKGLIVRTVDAADTRARRIRVTERGGELAAAAVTAVEAVDDAFFRAVPDPGALLATLRTLARTPG